MLVAAMLRVRWMIIRSLGSSEQGSYVLKVNPKFDVKIKPQTRSILLNSKIAI